jgi:peptidyl-prolyl cis-trans isomerase A (cyclophilin A)
MKRFVLPAILIGATLASSCSDSTTNRAASNSKASPEIKKGVNPIPDAEAVLIEMETPAYGSMKIELYSNIAPKAVERFKTLVKEGYYNGIAFHSLIKTTRSSAKLSMA